MKNPNQDLFNFMKGLGKFQEYADYEDYKRKKLGITEEPTESYQEFLKGLTDKELEEFNNLFGNE